MKPATDGRIHWRGRIARKDNALARVLTRWIDNWHRTDERLGVGMQRLLQNRAGLTKLDNFSEIHHPDSVGDMFHNREIVRDEDKRQLHLVPKEDEQIDDLRLDGDIERGNRLVRDN